MKARLFEVIIFVAIIILLTSVFGCALRGPDSMTTSIYQERADWGPDGNANATGLVLSFTWKF